MKKPPEHQTRPNHSSRPESTFTTQVAAQARRKLKARRHTNPGLWFGLGMMGLVGWSVVVPTLLGAVLGFWLDKHHTGQHSWTLTLLIGGLILGCFNAWHWIDKEDKAIHKPPDDNNTDH